MDIPNRDSITLNRFSGFRSVGKPLKRFRHRTTRPHLAKAGC